MCNHERFIITQIVCVNPLFCNAVLGAFFQFCKDLAVEVFLLSCGYHSQHKSQATIGTPAKRHINGVSLAGRSCPTYICLQGLLFCVSSSWCSDFVCVCWYVIVAFPGRRSKAH